MWSLAAASENLSTQDAIEEEQPRASQEVGDASDGVKGPQTLPELNRNNKKTKPKRRISMAGMI